MCLRCYGKWHRNANKEHRKQLNKAWKKSNPEKQAAYQRRRDCPTSCYKYGLTTTEYRELVKKFNGVCPICSRVETRKAGARKCLSVDHDHKTGAIRGMLCMKCNVALGNFEDNPEWLRRAALYLEGRPLDGGHE